MHCINQKNLIHEMNITYAIHNFFAECRHLKVALSILFLISPLLGNAQRTYKILLWNPTILDERVPVRNGQGYYVNGGH